MNRYSLYLCLLSGLLFAISTRFQSADAQDTAGLIQFGQFLQNVVYPGLQELLGENKSWETFGIACNYRRKGGFYKWHWRYEGTISCKGLGKWKKDKCKSRGCAFKEPMKQYLTALARANVATKDQLIQYIQQCDCKFSASDKQEMINSINQA